MQHRCRPTDSWLINYLTLSLTDTFLPNGSATYSASAQDSLGRSNTTSVSVNLPPSAGYQYDFNGNLLSDGLRTFAYDDENQLITAIVTNGPSTLSRTDFAYDGRRRLRMRTESVLSTNSWQTNLVVKYVYDGNLVIQERDKYNVPLVSYTRGRDLSGSLQRAGGIGGLLARTDFGPLSSGLPSAQAYYHADGNGNITCLVDTNQSVVAKYLYDPFGGLLEKAGQLADVNHITFSSKEFHAISGLYYYGLRFYDPNLQRWLNRDPIGELGGLNIYACVGNNAVNRFDAVGLAWYDWPANLANWANQSISGAQDTLAGSLDYLSIPINNSLSAINMVAQAPNLIANLGTATGTTGSYIDEPVLQPLVSLGTGAGTWWSHPSWENASGLAADISTAASVLVSGLKPLPSANQPLWGSKPCPLLNAAEGTPSFFEGTSYTPKVLKQMQGGVGEFHSFPESVTAFESSGTVRTITGGDGVVRQVLEIPGSYGSGGNGVFQFIKNADGTINHRLFVPNSP
jgi:RHS repeat-associated protein